MLCALQILFFSLQTILTHSWSIPERERPQLDGAKFRITVVEESGFVDIEEDSGNGELRFSGYCIEILRALARPDRANFTFDLLTPSGYGSRCAVGGDVTKKNESSPYGSEYRKQYLCGESDVNELPKTNETTDFYVGLFYVTPERQIANQFTIPFTPPSTGTITMFGTATGVRRLDELVEQQIDGVRGPACVQQNTAYIRFLKENFPRLKTVETQGSDTGMREAFDNGICEVFIDDFPIASSFVLRQSLAKKCTVKGKPIGIIGESLNYGLHQYSFGIRNDIDSAIVDTLSFWLVILMTCSPGNALGDCPTASGGNLATLYRGKGGTGGECGYVNNPSIDRGLAPVLIVALVVGAAGLVGFLSAVRHRIRMKQQEHRYKKRFVQQISRNIQIGRSPGSLSSDELAAQVTHISRNGNSISKSDLAAWLNDLKMDFLAEDDFEALWNAIDLECTGTVDPIQFFFFLSTCGSAFDEVYSEQEKLPKTERIKLAARRLTNIERLGLAGVEALERKNDKIRCGKSSQ